MRVASLCASVVPTREKSKKQGGVEYKTINLAFSQNHLSPTGTEYSWYVGLPITCLTTFIVAGQDLAVDNGCLGLTITTTSGTGMLPAIA